MKQIRDDATTQQSTLQAVSLAIAQNSILWEFTRKSNTQDSSKNSEYKVEGDNWPQSRSNMTGTNQHRKHFMGYLVINAHTTQHNTTQHNTTQHNTTQHNTTQHNTTQHNTTQHNTTQHRQHNTTQHNTTQHNTTQHNTTQHNTTQHNTTQHNTTQHIHIHTNDPTNQS